MTVIVPKGDVTLACRHVNPQGPHRGLHVFKLGDGGVKIRVTPRDKGGDVQGMLIEATWLLLCERCMSRPGKPIEMARHHFTVSEEIRVGGSE